MRGDLEGPESVKCIDNIRREGNFALAFITVPFSEIIEVKDNLAIECCRPSGEAKRCREPFYVERTPGEERF